MLARRLRMLNRPAQRRQRETRIDFLLHLDFRMLFLQSDPAEALCLLWIDDKDAVVPRSPCFSGLRKGKSRMIARGVPAMTGLAIFFVTIYLASITSDPWLNVLWLSLALGSLGLPVVTSWAIAADKGGEFSGSVSGWMNTWGNVGAVFSPIICGWIAQNMGWDMALLSSIIPILIAIFLWFLIKPDDSLAEI
ncbi:hypothetical protein [Brevibacillus centrosporus]|uniref:hypothetical protein n=1 Tax=Brevibacillus centrosporus TaxID=54910 RepID=UPI003B019EDA